MDIMLSVFVHAGLVAGLTYGLMQDSTSDTAEIAIEPIFFEILEESVTGSDSAEKLFEGSVPTLEGSVPTFDAISETTPVVEPPSIEHVSNLDDEPVILPPPSIKPTESVEGSVSMLEGSVPMLEGSVPMLEGSVPTAEGSVPTAHQEQSRILTDPRALNKIVPVYPRSARRRGREGVVMLEIAVSELGTVDEVAIIEGSGYKDLDSAAISAVRTARFEPATEDGNQVSGRLRLTFEFKLR